jgi:hypothetical protein
MDAAECAIDCAGRQAAGAEIFNRRERNEEPDFYRRQQRKRRKRDGI